MRFLFILDLGAECRISCLTQYGTKNWNMWGQFPRWKRPHWGGRVLWYKIYNIEVYFQDIPSGILLFTGATDWDDVGRKTNNLPRSNNTFYSPLRLAALKEVQIEAVSSGPGAAHQFAITSEGKVYAWGRNENGQLGLEDLKDRKCKLIIGSSFKIGDRNILNFLSAYLVMKNLWIPRF